MRLGEIHMKMATALLCLKIEASSLLTKKVYFYHSQSTWILKSFCQLTWRSTRPWIPVPRKYNMVHILNYNL